MSAATDTARRMLERTGDHPVISVFFDLEPDQFATAPARATQLRSLLDQAHRGDTSLGHQDRTALTGDLKRLEEYLGSGDVPVSGARSLAVFCSGLDGLFETVKLRESTPPKLVIARTPYVEPLVAGLDPGRVCVVLVNRRIGRIFTGDLQQLQPEGAVSDDVHGRHSQGGWSQANYQRSVDHEAEQHMRHVTQELYRTWQREPFDRLVLGGPREDVARFADLLHNDLRPALSDSRVSLDVETASLADVQAAVRPRLDDERSAGQATVMAELAARLERDGPATRGLAKTLDALAQRRVETLLLSRNFAATGGHCQQCGLLYAETSGSCPVDGTELEPVADLREAIVEAAVLQGAAVVVAGEGTDPPPPPLDRGEGIAALLRF
jgi:peptide subunit release factor 1 (eRF1)